MIFYCTDYIKANCLKLVCGLGVFERINSVVVVIRSNFLQYYTNKCIAKVIQLRLSLKLKSKN